MTYKFTLLMKRDCIRRHSQNGMMIKCSAGVADTTIITNEYLFYLQRVYSSSINYKIHL